MPKKLEFWDFYRSSNSRQSSYTPPSWASLEPCSAEYPPLWTFFRYFRRCCLRIPRDWRWSWDTLKPRNPPFLGSRYHRRLSFLAWDLYRWWLFRGGIAAFGWCIRSRSGFGLFPKYLKKVKNFIFNFFILLLLKISSNISHKNN